MTVEAYEQTLAEIAATPDTDPMDVAECGACARRAVPERVQPRTGGRR